VELHGVFEQQDDLEIVYVVASNQLNDKSLRFINGLGLRDRIHFAVDSESRSIDKLGIRLEDPEPMEAGVPHPTTLLIDRDGIVQFVDARRDYHIWLDSDYLRAALGQLDD
jgi:peroxiredoxin